MIMNYISFKAGGLAVFSYILCFIVAILVAMFEFAYVLSYFLLVHLVYATVVSVLIEGWKTNGKLIVESTKEKWTNYINGIRVEENRHALKNLHFLSKSSMKTHYLMLLVPKLVIAVMLMLGLALQLASGEYELSLLVLAISIFSVVFFIIRGYLSFRAILLIIREQWVINNYEKDGCIYGSAYLKKGDKYVPLLDEVFR
jgi:hypothetical protein